MLIYLLINLSVYILFKNLLPFCKVIKKILSILRIVMSISKKSKIVLLCIKNHLKIMLKK